MGVWFYVFLGFPCFTVLYSVQFVGGMLLFFVVYGCFAVVLVSWSNVRGGLVD